MPFVPIWPRRTSPTWLAACIFFVLAPRSHIALGEPALVVDDEEVGRPQAKDQRRCAGRREVLVVVGVLDALGDEVYARLVQLGREQLERRMDQGRVRHIGRRHHAIGIQTAQMTNRQDHRAQGATGGGDRNESRAAAGAAGGRLLIDHGFSRRGCSGMEAAIHQ